MKSEVSGVLVRTGFGRKMPGSTFTSATMMMSGYDNSPEHQANEGQGTAAESRLLSAWGDRRDGHASTTDRLSGAKRPPGAGGTLSMIRSRSPGSGTRDRAMTSLGWSEGAGSASGRN
jgi:hypothetical protein